ncbi:MAG TPA: hypothetical protein VFB59_02830 [Candidatus Saccharimonadales bacterium]|nr:hypothetical protein [Candidatus Saccharimonadales bacterium]
MSTEVAIPFEKYEHIASAGIWETFPFRRDPSAEDLAGLDEAQLALLAEISAALPELTADTPPYPYLRLLLHKSPDEKEDLFVFYPVLTQSPEEPFIPPVETDDDLARMAEDYLVSAIYPDEDAADEPKSTVYDPNAAPSTQSPSVTLEALLPKSVRPIGLHQPIVDALGRLTANLGVAWDPKSLEDVADVGTDFYTFRTEVPDETVGLTLGDAVYRVYASGIVAAGLRMAVCQTIRMAWWRPVVDKFTNDPEALERLVKNELAALPQADRPAYLQLPSA